MIKGLNATAKNNENNGPRPNILNNAVYLIFLSLACIEDSIL